ncbi:MAG: tetratricopeptide repeat protein [Anaerolineaceae bacterium]|nr:tetratricopeptide repeat protein [Anaerolineaceae bacterium]
MQIEKTVFISYRRTNIYMARAVYQNLTAHGYRCFLDFESIDAGSFERIILGQIAARAHFIVVLTPSALERCADPNDWLRREIEYALELKRNMVPLMFDQFSFNDVQQYLVGKLAVLSQYNYLNIPPDYFDEAMDRLRGRFLNKPLDVILHPTPKSDESAVQRAQANEAARPTVKEAQLTAEQWFERGYNSGEAKDYAAAITAYDEAIRLNPYYAIAYNNRGLARSNKGDLDGAISDYTQSIELKNPNLHLPYNNRGNARYNKGDLDGAISDYNEAIRLNPQYAEAYNNRGNALKSKDNLDGAISDYTQSIELKNPELHLPYNNRGNARYNKGDLDGAISDFNEAIRLNPRYAEAFRNRGVVYKDKGDLSQANADFQRCIDNGGAEADKVRGWIHDIEKIMRQLK